MEKGLVRVKDLRIENSSAVADEDKQKDIPFDDLVNVDVYFGGSSGAAAPAQAKTQAASNSGPVAPKGAGPGLEAFLVDHPYVGGFAPSARDREVFDELQRSGRPTTPALARWYEHIESFPQAQRKGWS